MQFSLTGSLYIFDLKGEGIKITIYFKLGALRKQTLAFGDNTVGVSREKHMCNTKESRVRPRRMWM